MQLHQLKRKTPNKTGKRVGRGMGSKKGKTAGRGTKGQKARAGHKIFPQVREKIKKLPKLRGYSFKSVAVKLAVVNVSALEKFFTAGETVTPALLAERGLIRSRKGQAPKAKILGDGELAKSLTVSGCAVSLSAKEKIEKAGGSIA